MPARASVPRPRDLPGAPFLGLLSLAIVTVVAVALLAWRSVAALDRIALDRANLSLYAESIRELRSHVQESAFRGRGYAITGEASMLSAAVAASRRAAESSARAAELGSAYAPPSRFLAMIDGVDSLRGRFLRIQGAGTDGATVARALVRDGSGPALVERLLAELDALAAEAAGRQAQLIADGDAARRRLVVWLPTLAAVALLVAVLAALLLRSQARARARDLTRYRAIFDSTFQFIGLLTPDGTLLEANETALRFGGFPAEAVIGKPFWEARWWSASEATQTQLREAIARAARGEFVRYHVEVLGADDRRAVIDFSLKPVYDFNGEIAYVVPEGRDVTDVRKAEHALAESEERWNFALTGSDLGVWDWNAVTDEVFFSDRWKSMLGYAPDEIGGTLSEWSSRVHPEDLPDALAAIQAHFDRKTPYYVSVHRVRAKDGRYREILDRGKVIVRGSDGRPQRVIGTHQDITEQREAEAAARQLQQQMSALLRHSPSLIAVIDRDGRYLRVSQSVAAAVGKQTSELVGRRLEEVLPADTVATLRARLQQVERSGAAVDVEDSVGPADAPRRYRTVYFPMRDEAGAIFAIGTVAVNISDAHLARLKLEQALDENRVLQGLLSICAQCKRIHDKDDAQWKPVERYVQDHTAAVFSHGLCPSCTAAFMRESGLDTEES